ncbi:MAG: helix-turn-helix transcriptional regulator, partial [Actinobacteria bacterium]|nr:helix-turn-helix transcriptional regulator [Actinomycetota bacterium]
LRMEAAAAEELGDFRFLEQVPEREHWHRILDRFECARCGDFFQIRETFCLCSSRAGKSTPRPVATKKTDWTLEKRLGEVVTREREALDLSQEDLAHRAGLSTSTIQKYEAGEREPRARALLQLASALEVSADVLLEHSHWVQPKIGAKGYIHSRVRPIR